MDTLQQTGGCGDRSAGPDGASPAHAQKATESAAAVDQALLSASELAGRISSADRHSRLFPSKSPSASCCALGKALTRAILATKGRTMGPTDMAAIHSDEFKRDAVRIGLTSGLTRRQVACQIWGSGFRRSASGFGRFRRKPRCPRRMPSFCARTNGFAKRTAYSGI